jgi:phosphatidylserine decarboxylase
LRVVRTGIYYFLTLVGAAIVIAWLAVWWLATPLLLAAVFCLYFFRDPERASPSGPVAVAPADGTIVSVTALSTSLNRITIFLSVFDVHVNRAPIDGQVSAVEYCRGRFHRASIDAASIENEHNIVTVQGAGTSVTFKQIAGIIVRRIVFSKKVGDRVSMGERVGLIKFGSRVDIFLGPEWEISIRLGQHVTAGMTVIAERVGSKI